jgi:hypothetical protein
VLMERLHLAQFCPVVVAAGHNDMAVSVDVARRIALACMAAVALEQALLSAITIHKAH